MAFDFITWREKNREKIREYARLWRSKNREKITKYNSEWRRKNRDKVNKKIRIIHYAKMENIPTYRIRRTVRQNIRNRLGENWEGAIRYLPYSVVELKLSLEKNFEPGMSWENYGEWQIDHVIPDSFFDYSTPYDPEFKASWALENLQPLWKEDNLKKNSLGIRFSRNGG